jgi:hypothetical protein
MYYTAPGDCLQYFTAASGRVKSFNWQDVAGTTTRQLNNQNYNICFRTELVSSQVGIVRYFRTSVNLIAFIDFYSEGNPNVFVNLCRG